MGFSFEKLSDLEILKITVEGTLNLSQKKEIYSKAISELNIYGYQRVLFDGFNAVPSQNYTSEDMLDMANYIKESELPEDTKLAFLGRDNKSDHKTFEVFVNIMIPLELKSFSNYNKAINWLAMN